MRNTLVMTLVGLTTIVGISGCASNYVANDSAEMQIKQYGVVVNDYKLYDGRKNPLSGTSHQFVTDALEQDIVSALQEKGLSAKVVPASELADMLKHYADLPRGRAGIKNPGSHNLGDQHEAFNQLGIDGLVVVTGNSVINNTTLTGLLGATALTTAQALAAGFAAPSVGVDVITTMEMSIVGPTGAIRHHYGDYFVFSKGILKIGQKKGDIVDPTRRRELVGIYVDRYVKESDL